MARPKKNTIDYFPHPVNDGTRMFIMEQKYEDKGYCCYYKLLQLLGRTENHFLDFKNAKDRIFFAALIKTDEVKMFEMISTMAEISAIDFDLWHNFKVIWSQDLVDSVKELYINRKRELPEKPSFYTLKPTQDGVSTPENTTQEGVSTPKSTHSRVEYSKVKKSKVFIPPTLLEFQDYFKQEGYNTGVAERAWKGYDEANWHKSNGKPILNWKQTCQNVWFKDENKCILQKSKFVP